MGGFIAREDIAVGEAKAYTRGQSVTAEAVKANGWQDLVVAEDSKEGREIKAEITGRPTSDFETKTTAAKSATAPKEG